MLVPALLRLWPDQPETERPPRSIPLPSLVIGMVAMVDVAVTLAALCALR